jgi:hypothetical protein
MVRSNTAEAELESENAPELVQEGPVWWQSCSSLLAKHCSITIKTTLSQNDKLQYSE